MRDIPATCPAAIVDIDRDVPRHLQRLDPQIEQQGQVRQKPAGGLRLKPPQGVEVDPAAVPLIAQR